MTMTRFTLRSRTGLRQQQLPLSRRCCATTTSPSSAASTMINSHLRRRPRNGGLSSALLSHRVWSSSSNNSGSAAGLTAARPAHFSSASANNGALHSPASASLPLSPWRVRPIPPAAGTASSSNRPFSVGALQLSSWCSGRSASASAVASSPLQQPSSSISPSHYALRTSGRTSHFSSSSSTPPQSSSPSPPATQAEIESLQLQLSALKDLMHQTHLRSLQTQALASRAVDRSTSIENRLADVQSHVAQISGLERITSAAKEYVQHNAALASLVSQVGKLDTRGYMTSPLVIGSAVVGLVVVYQYRSHMYARTSEEVADIASMTLQQDTLRRSIQETLATVANSTDTLSTLNELLQKLIRDDKTVRELVNLLVLALGTPEVRDACIALITTIFADPHLRALTGEFLLKSLDTEYSRQLLDSMTQDWVKRTVLDDEVQRNAGVGAQRALWYAARPKVLWPRQPAPQQAVGAAPAAGAVASPPPLALENGEDRRKEETPALTVASDKKDKEAVALLERRATAAAAMAKAEEVKTKATKEAKEAPRAPQSIIESSAKLERAGDAVDAAARTTTKNKDGEADKEGAAVLGKQAKTDGEAAKGADDAAKAPPVVDKDKDESSLMNDFVAKKKKAEKSTTTKEMVVAATKRATADIVGDDDHEEDGLVAARKQRAVVNSVETAAASAPTKKDSAQQPQPSTPPPSSSIAATTPAPAAKTAAVSGNERHKIVDYYNNWIDGDSAEATSVAASGAAASGPKNNTTQPPRPTSPSSSTTTATPAAAASNERDRIVVDDEDDFSAVA